MPEMAKASVPIKSSKSMNVGILEPDMKLIDVSSMSCISVIDGISMCLVD